MVHYDATDALHAQLLRRIAEQDHQAVAEFYDQVAGALFSTAVRIMRDTHDAEEVLQDVFVQIWSKARDFDPALGTAIHWVLSITRHRCIDRVRSRQRRSRLLDEMTEQADAASAPSVRTPHLIGTAELNAVHDAVKSLPDEQRVAIEMAFFGDLPHGEIAEALGEPLGTIKARIRRGMMKLRDQLKRYV